MKNFYKEYKEVLPIDENEAYYEAEAAFSKKRADDIGVSTEASASKHLKDMFELRAQLSKGPYDKDKDSEREESYRLKNMVKTFIERALESDAVVVFDGPMDPLEVRIWPEHTTPNYEKLFATLPRGLNRLTIVNNQAALDGFNDFLREDRMPENTSLSSLRLEKVMLPHDFDDTLSRSRMEIHEINKFVPKI